MGPYSHYILAQALCGALKPDDPADYFWGAIIPDIRYLAEMRRERTHLSQTAIQEYAARYPHLKSFLLGYTVHCLIDQYDFPKAVSAAFPLNLLQRARRKTFSPQQMTMFVEMYFLQALPVESKICGCHNEMLGDLGITPEQTNLFFQAMQEYIQSHSFEGALAAFQKIHMIENGRIEKYPRVYQSMQSNSIQQTLLILSVRNARLEQRVPQYVRVHLA